MIEYVDLSIKSIFYCLVSFVIAGVWIYGGLWIWEWGACWSNPIIWNGSKIIAFLCWCKAIKVGYEGLSLGSRILVLWSKVKLLRKLETERLGKGLASQKQINDHGML